MVRFPRHRRGCGLDESTPSLARARHVVVQTAPAVRVSLGEEFGRAPGTVSTGRMVAALRRLGFARVFDTDFTADLTIGQGGLERRSLPGRRTGPATPDRMPGERGIRGNGRFCSPGGQGFLGRNGRC